ncbi:DUF1624 domain-containing protein [Aureimonas ureilytica]|uniref:DUF1624 domain-containing protein n=1 Tax=Aureimonas ureilytica TaxID=401562 RepID=UPI000374515B|nr:heparan-alpha-glucosaminide N-acetyltransferase [Aureimonas ureilytica]
MTVPEKTQRGRIELLDVARGVALLAMLVYHFTWDLEFFGYLPAGFAQVGGWKLFARCIASSFLILVGVSLVLAHARAIRWPSFRKRFLQIGAGALAISIATFWLTPQGFVFFGILHLIALGSLLGLAFLTLPFWATATSAAVVIGLPSLFTTALTDSRWLAWIGFSEHPPLSNDFVPLFPWFGAILIGIALAQLFDRIGAWPRLARLNDPLKALWPLSTLGRHSLLFYLLHQPISFGLVALAATISPPDQTEAFRASCQQTCEKDRDTAFCVSYCGCVETRLKADDLLEKLLRGQLSESGSAKVRDTVNACSFEPSAQP